MRFLSLPRRVARGLIWPLSKSGHLHVSVNLCDLCALCVRNVFPVSFFVWNSGIRICFGFRYSNFPLCSLCLCGEFVNSSEFLFPFGISVFEIVSDFDIRYSNFSEYSSTLGRSRWAAMARPKGENQREIKKTLLRRRAFSLIIMESRI